MGKGCWWVVCSVFVLSAVASSSSSSLSPQIERALNTEHVERMEEEEMKKFIRQAIERQSTPPAVCPLAAMGPGSDSFFETPQVLQKAECGNIPGMANNAPTCCQPKYFDSVGQSTDPFMMAAVKLLTGTIPPQCKAKVSAVSCGVCRSGQAAFVQNHSYVSELRLCESFCSSLLQSCGSASIKTGNEVSLVSNVYQNDPAKFCNDLYADITNVKVTVVTLTKLRSFCFSDVPECTADDFVSFYTDCDAVSKTRAVYFDYKPDSMCRGGQALPPSIGGLPCYQGCERGHYLPIGTTECVECPAGTYSAGGIYNDVWKDWPADFQFTTYCERNNGNTSSSGYKIDESKTNCSGWILNDTFVESGVVSDFEQAVLESKVYLVRDGYVRFEFKVMAEQYCDGLILYVDGSPKTFLVSMAHDWMSTELSLSAGFHTLKWVYFKDYSESHFWDMAMINEVLIVGTKWSDSYCTECTPGHYSEHAGHGLCAKCPRNTYSDDYGATQCTPCPADHYALFGSTECIKRLECTSNDYYFNYTPCVEGARNKTYHFVEPAICHTAAFALPPNEENIPCADCNPGMYRAPGSSTCQFCASGTYSSTVGAQMCNPCPAGTAAQKALHFTNFDSWSDLGMRTTCFGDCATDGFTLLSDRTESGIGHGDDVDVNLYLNVTMTTSGLVEYTYSMKCTNFCQYQLIDLSTGLYRSMTATAHTNESRIFNSSLPLSVGPHALKWVFNKFGGVNGPYDRLTIYDIIIHGSATGGALECVDCPAGTSSSEGSTTCSNCSIGYYSPNRSATCILCPDGTFGNRSGASECLSCGANTHSLPDRTDCDYNNCVYAVSDSIVYDLSPLQIAPGADLYGPVRDLKNHIFYLNPCTRVHSNRTCYDFNNQTILSHACQELPMGYSMNLGYIQGYLPLEDANLADDPIRSGLVMTFTEGTYGCPDRAINRSAYARSTNITFICNPFAGKGFPVAVEPVEKVPCRYNFMWSSSYACPLCTLDDYEIVFGQCLNGNQTLTYYPKTVPNRCVGGIQAPPPSKVPCVASSVNCQPGYYLPVDGVSDNDCVPARPGRFSIGGGFVINQFTEYDNLPPQFDRFGSWELLGDVARSGNGDTALTATVFMLKKGYVSFDYKVFTSASSVRGFQFTVDGNPASVRSHYTELAYFTMVTELKTGEHVLSWRFSGGSPPTKQNRGNYVVIRRIAVFGTELTARSDIACPAGYYQNVSGQTLCLICPADTRSYGGASSCSRCDSSSYSFPGSSECELRTSCTASDFVIRYRNCSGGRRMKYYIPVQPQICILNVFPFRDNGSYVPCLECEPGFEKKNEQCVPCDSGTYWTNTTMKCVSIPAGYSATPTRTYSVHRSTLTNMVDHTEVGFLPPEFSTYCSGWCGSKGWRMLNDTFDSGIHSDSEVDSVLLLNATIIAKGSISFKYTLFKDSEVADDFLDGLQFFIQKELKSDGKMNYHPPIGVTQSVTYDLDLVKGEPTPYTFAWVYHQPQGARGHDRIVLSDIVLVGDQTGTSVATSKCPRGTYSNGASNVCARCPAGTEAPTVGATQCINCKDGYFSSAPGTAECEPCGQNTNSSSDHTYCDISTCKFSYVVGDGNATVFDLSTLSQSTAFLPFWDTRYEISLCKLLGKGSLCFTTNRQFISTYVCAVNMNSGVGRSVGTVANVNYDFIMGSPDRQLRLVYNKGDICASSKYAETQIRFICNTSKVLPTEGLVLVNETNCGAEFEWQNIAACRVCTQSDYTPQYGPCKNDRQTVTYVRNSQCNGAAVREFRTQECVPAYDVSASLVVAGVMLFLCLLVIVVVVAIRNKRLQDKYELLINEGSSQRDSGRPESDPQW